MEYQRKYPITQVPGEYIILTWERGYKNVSATYRDREVLFIDRAAKIKKGVKVQDPELGNIQLSFSERPMMVNVVVDGYHSPINNSHPAKELKPLNRFFYLLAFFVLVSFGINTYLYDSAVLWFLSILDLFAFSAYIVTAIFLGKGKGWAYFIGMPVFALFTLFFIYISLVPLAFYELTTIIKLIIRLAVLGVLLWHWKTATSAIRHARFNSFTGDDLLDEIKR